ncbi:MAG TPA: class I SAM-dependent methyltransferase [Pseudoxanthomonas sp.]
MATFKDHFSQVADAYANWRPTYPDALFDAITAVVPANASVWEPGCGSGQATCGLAVRFAQVFATDPSAAQIEQHWAKEGEVANVRVAVEPGEATSLADRSVGLVAVAQALHWFDRARFFAECERVLQPGGVLAAWTYQDMVFSEDLAPVAAAFRTQIEPYWPSERAQVDAGYADYAWPFPALPAPALWLTAEWNLPQLLGYLGSLSATARCRTATGRDPVQDHADALASAWGDPQRERAMRWPLILHLRPKPL